MSTFETIINKYRAAATSEADKGKRFERLMQAMLRTLPPYSDELAEVWLWNDFPYKGCISGQDSGIDLVGLTHGGQYWAVQCKCYRSHAKVDKPDVDTFFTSSSRSFADGDGRQHYFSLRLWIDTTEGGFTSLAQQSFVGQLIPATVLHLSELAEMPIDWEELDRGISGSQAITSHKQVRPHQQEAIDAALRHYAHHDRGKLIMACGTGKTFTALRIAEALEVRQMLFLVPSIALMGQTLREWCLDAQRPLRPLCICSDSEVSRTHSRDDDSNITHVEELAWPASTSVEQIKQQFRALQVDEREGMLVVFSTYQSIARIAEAQQALGEALHFDLIVCDEAHRTTGVTLKGEDESAFVRVHDGDFVHASRRMYMTATPRLYRAEDQQKARDREAYLCSMDDTAIYGDEFYRLGFGEAVDKNLLSDYKVLILNVEPEDVNTDVQEAIAGLDEAVRREVDTDDIAKLIGVINALSKRSRYDNRLLREVDPQPMHRAVAFCQNIKTSKAVATAFNACAEAYYESLSDDERRGLVHVEARHVDGSMGAAQREEHLGWLKRTRTDGLDCHLLSNVRCLSEGVDVPSLDAVVFLAAKNSQVDVVQSVGRVMRRAEGKKYGYIIIPIVVPSDVDPEVALDDNKTYAVVWEILNALRAHDDRFNAMVNKIELNKKRPDTVQIVRPGSHLIGQGGTSNTADTSDGDGHAAAEPPAAYQTQLELRFGQLQNVIFARMVQKVGDKRYWEQWAADVAKIAERHIAQITALVASDAKARHALDTFMHGLHADINPAVGEAQAIEMLAQHIITQPVFEALFDGYTFADNNPISKAMSKIVQMLNDRIDEADHRSLQNFYDSVRRRAEHIDNAEAKQKIVVELYDKFFTTAFPRLKEQLGIVYTPVDVVDFIIHSVEHVLRQHFGRSLNDRGVSIIDPFTGTGTFITRLLQSGIIHSDNLQYKYQHEIHANEIVLLAYYIASVNIENVYHDLSGNADHYSPFEGICLTDTFELGEQMYARESEHKHGKQTEATGMETPFKENSKRVQRQLNSPITVIMGNPPYSVGQKSVSDNAPNQHYPLLEKTLEKKYVTNSSATSNKALYDSYIKAFRYATDRVGEEGIVAFVSNGAWLDNNAFDGFRKSIEQEFAEIYVFNLRGNQRTSGELSRREGGKIFGSGSRTPVSITLLVKKPHEGKATIHYHDIGDYLSREQKLDIIRQAHSIATLPMDTLHPNEHGDWINLRNDNFSSYIPIEPERKFNVSEQSFFLTHSLGVATHRDVWVYNYSRNENTRNVQNMIDVFDAQRKEYVITKEFSDTDIIWATALRKALEKNKELQYSENCMTVAQYRPFCKQYIYYDDIIIDVMYLMRKLWPTPQHKNLVISMCGVGGTKDYSCLISDVIPDLQIQFNGQCFPLYWYEEKQGTQTSLFGEGQERWIRHDAVTDFILKRAREQYGGRVTKEDIFYYVYGFLHCPAYRTTFANDLKKMLPRLPLVERAEDFWAFSEAGRRLADLHLHYEEVEPTAEVVLDIRFSESLSDEQLFRVEQMRFGKGSGKEKDRSTIVYNPFITLKNIPLRAYDYVVNGKSAIEWIMERYCDKVDKKSGIRNDANQWGLEHGNPRYALDLLQSIIALSLRTLDIVEGLPKVEF